VVARLPVLPRQLWQKKKAARAIPPIGLRIFGKNDARIQRLEAHALRHAGATLLSDGDKFPEITRCARDGSRVAL